MSKAKPYLMCERKNARGPEARRVWDLYSPDGVQRLEICTDARGLSVFDVDGNQVYTIAAKQDQPKAKESTL